MSVPGMDGMVTTDDGSAPRTIPATALGSDFTSSVHLYFFHWMWQKIIKTNDLHPAIPQNRDLAIACVNDSTGIWSIDCARAHPTWRCDMFDTTAEQFPPPAWLPKNCSLSVLDFTKPIPVELRGQYDVVRCPWVSLQCRKGDFMKIVDNVLLFLKPGGYLQWEESDIPHCQVIPARPEVSVEDCENLLAKNTSGFIHVSGSDFEWISELDKHCRSRNLIVLAHDRHHVPDHLAQPWTLQHLMVAMAMIQNQSNSEQDISQWLDTYDRAAINVMQGCSMRMDACICIAQVPPGRQSKADPLKR